MLCINQSMEQGSRRDIKAQLFIKPLRKPSVIIETQKSMHCEKGKIL